MVNICTISIQHTIKQNLRNIRNIFLKGTIRTHNPGFSFFGSKNDTLPDRSEREQNYALIIAQSIKLLKL